MKSEVVRISDRECYLFVHPSSRYLLVQPVDEHDLQSSEKRPLAKSIYLSLGDKEEKAKNPVMALVGNAIRKQHELLMEQEVNTILEWNIGNHFVDSEKRMAKGFAWLLNNKI